MVIVVLRGKGVRFMMTATLGREFVRDHHVRDYSHHAFGVRDIDGRQSDFRMREFKLFCA